MQDTLQSNGSESGRGSLDALLERVGRHLGIAQPAAILPSAARWSGGEGADGKAVVHLEMDADTLTGDLVGDEASSPLRAVCLAAWLEELGTPARAELVVRGTRTGPIESFRRSLFLIDELGQLLPELFSSRGASRWAWPRDPVFNVEGTRNLRKAPRGTEAKLAAALRANPAVRAQLEELTGKPVEPLRDQLPVGLFEGEVDKARRWTPGGSSAVDLWTRTVDRREMHLFELKAGRSRPFGVLAEALYYARLLSYVRDLPAIDFDPSGDGMTAARACSTLFMWLSAPGLHPLVHHPAHGSAPLRRLGAALAPARVHLGVLPVREGEAPAFVTPERWSAP